MKIRRRRKKFKHVAATATPTACNPLQTDLVKKLNVNVRLLAMQKTPSEQLVFLTLDELADTTRVLNHEAVGMYQEQARQANMNQGQFNIPTFILNVLGGKSSNLISKALTKPLKT